MEREELHRIIDEIPESKLSAVGRLLKDAVDIAIDDPVRKALASAPLDDEPVTDEERERIQHSDEDFQSDRTVSMDDVKRELDL